MRCPVGSSSSQPSKVSNHEAFIFTSYHLTFSGPWPLTEKTCTLTEGVSKNTGHDSPWNEKEHLRILNLKLLLKTDHVCKNVQHAARDVCIKTLHEPTLHFLSFPSLNQGAAILMAYHTDQSRDAERMASFSFACHESRSEARREVVVEWFQSIRPNKMQNVVRWDMPK